MLHLLNFNLSINDLKLFRQLDSITPGHPEANHHLLGIEVSTGPLGQGISNAVGLAISESHLAATFNRPNFNIIDNYTYCICGDGCLQEGVAAEAISLAGHLKLGKLIVFYDDNKITIDGETDISFTEDVIKRFESYGWHTSFVQDGDDDINSIQNAIQAAKKVTDKPSLIKIQTTIGFGSLNQGLEKVHGAPLSAADIKQLKEKFNLPDTSFTVSDDVYKYYHDVSDKNLLVYQDWVKLMNEYSLQFPELYAEFIRRQDRQLPKDWESYFPTYSPSDPAIATRKLSENVLNKIADQIPELIGGSADLTGSNLTRWKTAIDYQPQGSHHGTPSGRYLRFGVREHAMFAISNGISAYGLLIPFAATFFNFISYGLGAVRLSALSKHQVLYIMTHDSIGLGEDGPTHQPIETLCGLRAMPNILNFRPADGNEVSGCYIEAFKNTQGPSVLILTRQNLPHLENSLASNVKFGAYVIKQVDNPSLIIVATGSEVHLAISSAKKLDSIGIRTRVVSMPCMELFELQDLEYKKTVFSQGVAVLSVEVYAELGWSLYAHASVCMKSFGASAPIKDLMEKFGFVEENVVDKGRKLVEFYKGRVPEWKVVRPF